MGPLGGGEQGEGEGVGEEEDDEADVGAERADEEDEGEQADEEVEEAEAVVEGRAQDRRPGRGRQVGGLCVEARREGCA